MKRFKKFFHNKKGDFIVPYFWASVFLFLTVVSVIIEIVLRTLYYIDNAKVHVSLIPLISILIGVTMAMIAVYTWGKEKK